LRCRRSRPRKSSSLPNYVDQTNCLILDIAMPGMTGPISTELRFRRKEIRVVFITAHRDESVRPRMLELGGRGVPVEAVQRHGLAECGERRAWNPLSGPARGLPVSQEQERLLEGAFDPADWSGRRNPRRHLRHPSGNAEGCAGLLETVLKRSRWLRRSAILEGLHRQRPDDILLRMIRDLPGSIEYLRDHAG